jgi:uroporphyrinogen-III synthase
VTGGRAGTRASTRRRGGRTLAGRTVVVTRPAERSGRLVTLLERRGARVISAPTIAIRPSRSVGLTRSLESLAAGCFDWIVLTSPATVAVLADRLDSPRNVRAAVAAIGDGTAETFRRWARRDVDLRAPRFTTSSLGRAFPRGQGHVLCARADIAPRGLEDAIAAKGWTPVRVEAYRTIFAKRLPREARAALEAGEVDVVTFTSASTVRGFVAAGGVVVRGTKVVCIGPVTAKEARSQGLPVHALADPHTTDGLVAAVERATQPRTRVRA